MRYAATAALLLAFPASAIAGTFVYTPVHVAPVVHVPTFHAAPIVRPGVTVVKPGVTTVRPGLPGHPYTGHHHAGHRLIPVTVDNSPQNAPRKKCAEQKSGDKQCAK